MKKKWIRDAIHYGAKTKTWKIMRLSAFFLFLFLSQVWAGSGYSQQTKLTLKMNNAKVLDVLDEIENNSEFYFMFNQKLVDVERKVDVDVHEKTIGNILNEVFSGTDVSHQVKDRLIILTTEKTDFNTENVLQQQKSVSGKVNDEAGEPLPGVTVIIKGTTNGTVTNMDGNYTISNLPNNATLQFSFVGMLTQEIEVGNQSTINLTMVADAIGIEEVVAVGYGIQKKANLTGAVSAVAGEELAKRQVGQTSMALQGIIPGVTITQRSGQPGKDGGTIRIRGIGTLGDANPLVLIDNVESNMNNIDPNLIENISVLKDAASSAIYGSRAANGVILITTKRAKENTFTVNYSHYSEWQQPTDFPNKVNAVDHMTLTNTSLVNAGRTPIFDQSVIDNYPSLHASDPERYADTDWQKELYTENGYTQNHFLNLSGGTDRIKIIAAFGYYNQKGIIVNTDYQRMTMRLNSDIKFSDKFSANIDVSLLQSETNEPNAAPNQSSGVKDIAYWGVVMSAIEPVYNSYGYALTSTGLNAVAAARASGYQQSLAPSARLNLGIKYDFTKDLYLDFNYIPTFSENRYKDYRKVFETYSPDGKMVYGADTGSLTERDDHHISNNLRSTLNFRKSINAHNFKLLAGFSQEDYSNRWISAYRDTYILPQYEVINAGSTANQQSGGSGSDWALRSYFGRVNYDYNGKYLFEANVRYDGSSRFAPGKKYGVFPSFSVGWRMSQEKFWTPLKDVVSNVKFRGSWGQLGNQNIGTYPFDSFVSFNQYPRNSQSIDGAALTAMANPNISWESTEMINFGTDITAFDRLSFTFDYYVKNTSGVLLRLDVPKIVGLEAPYQNAGEVENKGWELGLNYGGKKNDFGYDLNFVISDVKNEIIDLKGIGVDGLVVNFEGEAMNSFYGYEAIGYFESEADIANSPTQQFGTVIPGSIKYKNQNDDDVIDSEDRKIIGSTIPRYTYSLNANLNWKNFDLSILLQGVGKANGYLNGVGIFPVNNGSTALEMHKDYWTTDNTDAQFPAMAFGSENNFQNSTFWVKDASYLRVKNLQLGYTLPQAWLNAVKIQSLRVYLSGSNLLTFDNFYDGYDVEAPVSNGGYYPQVKTYSIGVNVNF